MHRVFIAINLPEQAKNQLVSEQKNIEDLFASVIDENSQCPIRMTKKDNLHITLAFIGNCSDQEIAEICDSVKNACQNQKSFQINLNEISIGPSEKSARMVWAKGETPKELENLRKKIETKLLSSSLPTPPKQPLWLRRPGAKATEDKFNLHITLGRIIQWQWRRIEPEEMPNISKEISLNINVNSIDVMESKLKPRGPEYTILESIKLTPQCHPESQRRVS